MFFRQSKIYHGCLCVSWLLLSAIFSLNVPGQAKRKRLSHTIPLRLERQLVTRLDLFTEAQSAGDWEKVASFLVDSVNEEKVTGAQRERMLELIKERPVISFVPETTVESTVNARRPLNKREWELLGCAEYRDNNRVVRFPARVFAFLRKGQWVFTAFSRSSYPSEQIKLSCTQGEAK